MSAHTTITSSCVEDIPADAFSAILQTVATNQIELTTLPLVAQLVHSQPSLRSVAPSPHTLASFSNQPVAFLFDQALHRLLLYYSGDTFVLLACLAKCTRAEATRLLLSAIQTAAPLPLRFLLSAAMLGWSGLCVHAQVLSLALPAGLPARPYLRGKLLHGLYSALLSLLMLPLLAGETAPAAAFPAPAPEAEGLWRAACVALLALFFILLWKSGAGFGIIKKTDQGGGKRHAVR